jgi:hypothetical protein
LETLGNIFRNVAMEKENTSRDTNLNTLIEIMNKNFSSSQAKNG